MHASIMVLLFWIVKGVCTLCPHVDYAKLYETHCFMCYRGLGCSLKKHGELKILYFVSKIAQ